MLSLTTTSSSASSRRTGTVCSAAGASYAIPGFAILAEVRRAHLLLPEAMPASAHRKVLTVRFPPGNRSVADAAADFAAHAERRRLVRAFGLSSDVVDVDRAVSAPDVGRIIRRGNADHRVAGIHVAGCIPFRLAGLHDDISPSKRLFGPDPGVSEAALAVMRILQPFLGKHVTSAVVGTDTPLGVQMIGLLRAANTMPITLNRSRDLQILQQVDVVVSTDAVLALPVSRNLRRSTALVVHAYGDSQSQSNDDRPQAVLADRGGLTAVETALFSEHLARVLYAPALPQWKYLVAGPGGRMTSAKTDVLIERDAGRLVGTGKSEFLPD